MTLIEYGDYECPYCGQAEVVIRSLLDSFGDDLRYVWRHVPLNDVHPSAQMAAEAAEAAGAQGRFWEMHDRLLAQQDSSGRRTSRATPTSSASTCTASGTTCAGASTPSGSARTWRAPTRAAWPARPRSSSTGVRHQGAYDIDTLSEAVRRARKLALQRGPPQSALTPSSSSGRKPVSS